MLVMTKVLLFAACRAGQFLLGLIPYTPDTRTIRAPSAPRGC